MALAENIEITKLRKRKGTCRIWHPNQISDIIMGIDYNNYPGLWHEFLESKRYESEDKRSEWIEHQWLLRGFKDDDNNTDELLKMLGKLISDLRLLSTWDKKVSWYGLTDIETTDPTHYYFLISIISNESCTPRKISKEDDEEKEESY